MDENKTVPEQENTLQLQEEPKRRGIRKIKLFKGLEIDLLYVFGIFVAFAAVSGIYLFFLSNKETSVLSPISSGITKILEEDLVVNPLTGEAFTGSEANEWKDKRPLAVMVNNYTEARPQSGLIDADLTYEIVAEGGITRFLAFFLGNTPDKIGPVRSARDYYLVLVKELGDAMIMHIGWSPQALIAIETWPVRSLGRGAAEFWRDQERLNQGIATEHTAYVDGVYLREKGDELGWGGTREVTVWKFKDDTPIRNVAENGGDFKAVGEEKPITIDFWFSGDYSAIWKYDSETNSYLRFTGYDENGEPLAHIDRETKEQIKVKNVVIQFAVENPIVDDNKNRLDYELLGSGEGLVFFDGLARSVTWSKEERDVRTMFYTDEGEEVEFNRGKFWISIVPDRNKDQVTY